MKRATENNPWLELTEAHKQRIWGIENAHKNLKLERQLNGTQNMLCIQEAQVQPPPLHGPQTTSESEYKLDVVPNPSKTKSL